MKNKAFHIYTNQRALASVQYYHGDSRRQDHKDVNTNISQGRKEALKPAGIMQ
jgi:hypothetical protein